MGEHVDDIAGMRKPLRAVSVAILLLAALCIAAVPLTLAGTIPAEVASIVLGIPSDGVDALVGMMSLMLTGLISLVVGIFGAEISSGNDKAGLAAWVFGVGLFCEAFTTVNGALGSNLFTFSLIASALMLVGLVYTVRLARSTGRREREQAAKANRHIGAAGRKSRGSSPRSSEEAPEGKAASASGKSSGKGGSKGRGRSSKKASG